MRTRHRNIAAVWSAAWPEPQPKNALRDGGQPRPPARADVDELALLQLELLDLGPRELRPHVQAVAGLEVNPDLEAEVHDALDLSLHGTLGRHQQHIQIMRPHV